MHSIQSHSNLFAIVAAIIITSTGHGEPPVPITQPVPLNSNAVGDTGIDYSPTLATDGNGIWIVVWDSTANLNNAIGTDRDILFVRSTDGGQTWSDPAALNTTAGSDSSAKDEHPHIATDGNGTWLTVWRSQHILNPPDGSDFDIFVSCSTDDGLTWSSPTMVNDIELNEPGDIDFEPFVATNGGGRWVVVWRSVQDTVGGFPIGSDSDILYARSDNAGHDWTATTWLNTNAASDNASTDQDYQPRLIWVGKNTWLAVWSSNTNLNNEIDDDFDFLFARSTTNAQSWTNPQVLNDNAIADAGDDRYPDIVRTGTNELLAVWESNSSLPDGLIADWDIQFSRSTNGGSTWSNVTHVNSSSSSDSGDDNLPCVTTDALGNCAIVWHTTNSFSGVSGTETDIAISLSTDSGETWSDGSLIHSLMAGDSGADEAAVIETDTLGRWIAVWETRDSQGNTIGTEGDLLISQFALPDCNFNTIPDSSEPDKNKNDIPDDCEGVACAADIAPTEGNGVVNVDDLLVLIGQWGPCSGTCPPSCSADLAPASGGNCQVNVDDLLVLIGQWGPCS